MSQAFRIAIAQLPISGDARLNGERVRALVGEAAAGDARLVQFPEGMLSGDAKNPIQDWSEVDWGGVREELEGWPRRRRRWASGSFSAAPTP